jgi:hypothetical protein
MGLWSRGWGRVKQAFSANPEPETGAFELSTGSPTLSANVEGWRRERTGRHRANWTATAWDVYRYTPEVRAAVDWRTRAMSRVKLFAAWVPEDGGDPQPIEETAETKPLVDPVRELFGGPLQQASVLQQWERYRLVTGECIIAAVRPTIEERQRFAVLDEWLWMVRDASIATDHGTITLTWETSRGAITRRFDVDAIPEDVIYHHDRVRDPANPAVTDSPTRAVMDDAEIITNVSDSINAMSMSRIATAQMLVVSSDVTIPGYGNPATPDEEDPVMAGLVDTMGERVEQRRDPISRVPLIFRTASRSSETPVSNAVTTIDTTTRYDEHTLDILDWESRRIAIAFNVPAEVTNGAADPNHWNALYEGMDGARIVIAPDAADFCRLVTEIWYQWQLVTRGVPVATVRRVTVWYDASALVQDPDRSATMIALRQADPGAVTTQEVRRACGLPSEPDEPDSAPPQPVPVQRRSPTAGEVRGGAQAAVPSIPGGGRPLMRNPGFPTPPVALNGGRRA